MKINNQLLENAIELKEFPSFSCNTLGLVNSVADGTLTFLDDERFVGQLNGNRNISAVFVSPGLSERVQSSWIVKLVCEDPRYYFYVLQNYIAKNTRREIPSVIHPTARVHPKAYISEVNVTIGADVVVEPNATILPDVVIGEGCIIRAAAVLGSEGFEHKRTSKGIVSVYHDGHVILGKNVEIGANSCVDRGFSFRDTTIDDETKLDNLVHVAHGVQLGKRCFLAACAMIAGSASIGNDVWIGPAASVSSQIEIGNEAFVTIGSVVTKKVAEKEWVTGNFAIPHAKFLRNLKSITKD
ncbi:MAG: UDP-3-O-(3-hydroxymyristoyl) glucosamine N-acyltransferase [Bacteroidetes bacterium]|nr:UDP-3-O-(3-hydroxymyristoyl) glucosamine N-acyltransferase [Bacteroidota bacterium]